MAIDPIRKVPPSRRPHKSSAEGSERADEAASANLPVPVEPAVTVGPAAPIDGAGALEAQLLGQTGARRGLRAGATVIDTAKASYNRTQWSGEKDRRTPKGRMTKTDV